MNFSLQKELDKIATLLDITQYQMYQLSDSIFEDMTNKTMLKMLHTYAYCNVNIPDGEYLSVDFGGTNVRCYRFKVKAREIDIVKSVSFSLITKEKNYTTSEYSLRDIISLIVDNIETIIEKDKSYFLGHTFSFATHSLSKSSAKIIDMSKGFELRDAKDSDVNQILSQVLKERELKVEPVSIINDTTATLLTGNYYSNADIAIIIGTGHNACFKSKNGEIINMESAYMCKNIPLSYFDYSLLDKNSNVKNTLLEVLTGGKYLGLIAQEIVDELFEAKFLDKKLLVTSTILTHAVLGDLDDEYTAEEKETLSQIGSIILKRVAKIIVAEIMAILRYIDEDLEKEHCIVFDGSVYEKNKILQDYIKTYIEKIYGDSSKEISTSLIKDASAIGAIISIFPLQ